MRIGYASIYSWRPHVEHLYYLAGITRDAGHSVSFLACDGDLSGCYPKALHPERSGWVHCLRCRAGNIRSFSARDCCSIGSLADDTVPVSEGAYEGCLSSASTLGRFESDSDFQSPAFHAIVRSLAAGTQKAYSAALRWIERERLEAVCLFNGRMDATRGVMEAARSAGIPFVSLERTWFGDGVQLLPNENCLGLNGVDRMMTQWRMRPLTRDQALRATRHVAARFLRRNDKEWRAYNVSARTVEWPQADSARRVLLVPGSRNEIWGHPDWASVWPEQTAAYDALIDRFNLKPSELVLRCHPNWGERIGTADGSKAERYYTDWAARRGVHCIASTDTASTLGLIERCDALVVAGGSAALEGGILGKQVIAMGPSIYQQAGFQSDAMSPDALQGLTLTPASDTLTSVRIARQTLRFAYTMAYRVPQYVEYVRSVTATRYEYREGADAGRLIDMFRNGVIPADDATYAADESGEDDVLAMVARREWEALHELGGANVQGSAIPRHVHRRWMYRPIDIIRDAFPRGDR
ncbi:hypothetical protein AVE30378_03678 [Achromobacter veterisilvae]|uniref:Capsule polysaccharide biosynthesis protein n=1 Tax=Achromobacter veterisilvae TaxID=2069367 RepID=A0A446CPS1_9BURK|nr:hypothetical protein [Achromobacter veterisilvae]SSW69713.1 hypothetical protein AVE30378_03678 [Achromobacter veterisilvae]